MIINSFSNIGTRNKNEDSLGYNSNAYILCDGMGGFANGEIASKYVVEKLLSYTSKKGVIITNSYLEKVLKKIQQQLKWQNFWKLKPQNMGTTLVGLFKMPNGLLVSHIGDSRLYLIRPSESKIWHTWDHSEISNLIKSNSISREDGRTHPDSHSITRSISNSRKKDSVNADYTIIDDIKEGDIFFMCTDGVYEVWLEQKLMELICDCNLSIMQKTENIKNHCDILSTDNNSAFILEVEKEDEFSFGNNEALKWISLNDF